MKFAADSRISFPKNSPFDETIKVAPIRLEIDMINPFTLSDESLFHGDIGICFSGSTVNAFALREALTDRLRGLLMSTYEFASVARRAFNEYVDISRKLCEALAEPKGQSAVLIAGYCHESNSIKAFEFLPKKGEQNNYEFREILANDGDYLFIGSGAPYASQILKEKTCGKPNSVLLLSILQDVIDMDEVSSVGGKIRIGYFDKKNSFKSNWHGN